MRILKTFEAGNILILQKKESVLPQQFILKSFPPQVSVWSVMHHTGELSRINAKSGGAELMQRFFFLLKLVRQKKSKDQLLIFISLH